MKHSVLLLWACILVVFSCTQVAAAPGTQSNQNDKTVDLGELNRLAVEIPIVNIPPAMKRGVYGVVKVRVWINKKGGVTRTLVVSGPKPLRGAAVRSARGSTFAPGLGDCASCRYVTGVLAYTFVKQAFSRNK